MASLGIPGALILTLLAGAVFGWKWGTVIVSVSSTAGACCAFLLSRYFFRELIGEKYSGKGKSVLDAYESKGPLFLLSLRLVPIVPYFLVNLLMGVTRIPLATFALLSAVGMFPSTMLYVKAGVNFSQIRSVSDILSKKMLLLFCFFALIPVAANWMLPRIRFWWVMRKYPKPKSFDYNFVVVGAGSAGLVAANLGARLQAKVALVERGKSGGDCLNRGCVPSKTLLAIAKGVHHRESAESVSAPYGKAKKEYTAVRRSIQRVIEQIAPHDSFERYESLGVDCFEGNAEVISPYEVKVGEKVLTTKNVVIATGASPILPVMPGIREQGVYTSDTIWEMQDLPTRLLVLGGGAIGCELAQAFSRLGVKVTIVEKGPRILAREDERASMLLTGSLQKEGVKLFCETEAVRIDRVQEHLNVQMRRLDGSAENLEVDAVLVALGRKPNQEVFLNAKGIESLSRAAVKVDSDLSVTTLPNFFFCGDSIGPDFFTHAAGFQGSVVALNALFGGWRKFSGTPKVMPRCIFTEPEVASVGMGEDVLKREKIPFTVCFYSWEKFDRALTEGKENGFVKVFLARGSDKILGATIVGERAGEILQQIVFAMHHGKGLGSFVNVIQPYPSYADCVRMAALAWKNNSAPKWIFPWLRDFHKWNRI